MIAATHRNLENMISENRFREDLWFRLNVFPIILPPLRQRKEDIPALARYFIAQKSRELGIRTIPDIAPGALDRLLHYRWPGNVREMENLIEREIIRHGGGQLMFNSLLFDEGRDKVPHPQQEEDLQLPLKLDEAMSIHISRVLRMAKGKIYGTGGAADLLGINASTLRGRMGKLGIKTSRKK